MIIEIIVFPGLVFLVVTLTAKLIERRNDVLYGPYIQGRKPAPAHLRDQFENTLTSIGLWSGFGRRASKIGTAGHFASTIVG